MRAGGNSRTACAFALTLLASMSPALATPTFQTYIEGATAGNIGGDEDTWFTNNCTFNLVLVGAYTGDTADLLYGTLAVSVPQGQTGTITIGSATLLTTGSTIPNGDADVDALTNVAGNDAYADKSASFTLDNHFPTQDNVADFLYYSVGDFGNLGPIHNYDADAGTVTPEGTGEEKVFAVSVTGFDWVHFDLAGYVEKVQGNGSWELNPGSHDATVICDSPPVPVPGSLLLGAVGAAFAGWGFRRRAR